MAGSRKDSLVKRSTAKKKVSTPQQSRRHQRSSSQKQKKKQSSPPSRKPRSTKNTKTPPKPSRKPKAKHKGKENVISKRSGKYTALLSSSSIPHVEEEGTTEQHHHPAPPSYMSASNLVEKIKNFCKASDSQEARRSLDSKTEDCLKKIVFSSHWLNQTSRNLRGHSPNLCEMKNEDLLFALKNQQAVLSDGSIFNDEACLNKKFSSPSSWSVGVGVIQALLHSTTIPIQIVEYFTRKISMWQRILLATGSSLFDVQGGTVLSFAISVVDGLELFLLMLPQYRTSPTCIYEPTGELVPSRFILAASLLSGAAFFGGAVIILKGLGILDNKNFQGDPQQYSDLFTKAAMFGLSTSSTLTSMIEGMLEYSMLYTAKAFEDANALNSKSQVFQFIKYLFPDSPTPVELILPDYNALRNPIAATGKSLATKLSAALTEAAQLSGLSSASVIPSFVRALNAHLQQTFVHNVGGGQRVWTAMQGAVNWDPVAIVGKERIWSLVLHILMETKRRTDCNLARNMLRRYRQNTTSKSSDET